MLNLLLELGQMAQKSKLDLYDNAVPINEAWETFATPEQRTAFADAKGFPETLESSAQPAADRNVVMAMLETFNAAMSAKRSRDALISEMQDYLLDALFNSDLVALGIRQRPSKSHYPAEIDSVFFDFAETNWAQSTVQWEGKLYSNVRVYDPHATTMAAPPVPDKGSKSAIDRAIKELDVENPEFSNLPRKISCKMVRDKIGKSEIRGNGLSDQNLAKRIVAICGVRKISI